MCQACAKCFTNVLLHNTQDILRRYYYHHFTEEETEGEVRNFQKVTRLVKNRTRTWAKAQTRIHHAILASRQCRNGILDESLVNTWIISQRNSTPGVLYFSFLDLQQTWHQKPFSDPFFCHCIDRYHPTKDRWCLMIFLQLPHFSD